MLSGFHLKRLHVIIHRIKRRKNPPNCMKLRAAGNQSVAETDGSFSEAAVKMITHIDFVHTLKVSTILHNKVEPLLSSLPLELASTYLDIKLLCMDTFFQFVPAGQTKLREVKLSFLLYTCAVRNYPQTLSASCLPLCYLYAYTLQNAH